MTGGLHFEVAGQSVAIEIAALQENSTDLFAISASNFGWSFALMASVQVKDRWGKVHIEKDT
jgi:hypothetical protein